MSSSVRRRVTKDGGRSGLNPVETGDEKISQIADVRDNSEKAKLVSTPNLQKPTENGKAKGRKRRTGFIFFLGGLFGIIVAGFFAQKNELFELPEFADLLSDLSLDSLMDVLPAGFLQEARE